MLARRSGFTLIELLIVITILGILAAIAIPKFGRTRERAHFKAMMSDLRQLMVQQEAYFSDPANNYTYANSLSDFTDYGGLSAGVDIDISSASTAGWGATSAHAALAANQTCAVFHGTVTTVPAPATTAGIIGCTNE